YTWSGGYAVFALLCATTAWLSVNAPESELKPAPVIAGAADAPAPEAPSDRPTFWQMVLWVSLAACASVLLVSSTNHMSQNVAPIPLLWVLPLALYLLTFILCFEGERLYQRWVILPWLAPALSWMSYTIYANDGNLHIKYLIPVFAGGLFVACMMCHGELA